MAHAIFEEGTRRLREAAAHPNPALAIPSGVRIERVRVTETSSSWAEYFE
jgi:6-pyruvoyltetrahydropterin/6-carboxytetrahydropterin synthase